MSSKRSSIRELVPEGYKLLEMEALRWRAVQRRQELHQALWIPLFDQGKPLGKWWGIRQGYRVIFTCSANGISSSHISTPLCSDDILTLPDDELPLIMNDVSDRNEPSALQTLKDRMAGLIPQIPMNQYLVDLYEKSNRCSSRIGAIIGKCNELIEHYASHKIYEDHPRETHYDRDIMVTLTLNGRIYRCFPSRKFVIYPEDTIYTYNDQDVLKDEADKPTIHGYKRIRIVEPPTKPKRKPKAIA